MLKLNKKGFTLIELLVVIAIIGILASIVLVSLNDARNKGYDTQVKSDISQIRNAMEICYDTNGGAYGASCNTLAELFPTGGAGSTMVPPSCSGDAAYFIETTNTAYKIHADLCAAAVGIDWCVDSTGYAETVAANETAGDVACP
jgi:prepilin-type N-terminal cleavage/methylation domain-containing protein